METRNIILRKGEKLLPQSMHEWVEGSRQMEMLPNVKKYLEYKNDPVLLVQMNMQRKKNFLVSMGQNLGDERMLRDMKLYFCTFCWMNV